MRDHWQSLLQELNWECGQKVIDVGGAMDPVPVADVCVDILEAPTIPINGEYVKRDLTWQGLPFPDKYFDIAICCQTLEDLMCPTIAMMEIQRVAKRGIIEVPHRGIESVPQIWSNGLNFYGEGHHRYLIEVIDGLLRFTPKRADMLCRFPIPKWIGPRQIHWKWEGQIGCCLFYDVNEEQTARDFADFRERSREFWDC